MRTLVTLALLALAAGATPSASAADVNPVLGAWDWKPVEGVCPEVHTYAADGTARSESGAEVLTKTYTVKPVSGGMYEIDTTVTATNGGKDCLGSTTKVGATSKVFIQPLNGGGYFTCASQDGMSCYGNARPKTAK